ncbi:glycosyltransferase [Glaciihabitans arcticus]|uniref:D-inositol 3-phosphate glycosyltransferase n=1 Tax=Glaciihabitans arcticus TaxID=2668039 RepID=A0A4Q9GNK4_9MICO|nr:glycosyltransferase [Glaciihabitans arcticus]TBN56281.1 glycosyltransferase [Glaciihabitans arcticus]
MTGEIRRVAMVSMHTSPDAAPGSADAGSINVSLLETARELATRGVEVDLVTRATGETGSRAVAPGVTLHAVRAGPIGVVARDDLGVFSDEFGEEFARLAGRDGPRYDVIHAHYWLSGLATLPVAIELGVPFVQTFHSLAALHSASPVPGAAPDSERRLWSERYLAGQADAIVAVSAAEATMLIDRVGAPIAKLWVVPPGVDGDAFRAGRATTSLSVHAFLGIAAERPVIAVIGRLEPAKGQELAIQALATMPEPRPLLAVVGEPGSADYAAGLRTLAADLDVNADVRFLGVLDRAELAGLLAATSVALVPSYSESFGLVALEAAATGVPVVASAAGGLVESVLDGETGLLVASREPEDWARAIATLLGDDALRARMASSARLHAEGLSWGSTATSLLGVYASLNKR